MYLLGESILKYLNFRMEVIKELQERGVPESCSCTDPFILLKAIWVDNAKE